MISYLIAWSCLCMCLCLCLLPSISSSSSFSGNVSQSLSQSLRRRSRIGLVSTSGINQFHMEKHRLLESRILTIEQLDDAIEKAKSVLSLIHSRYEYDTPRGKLFVTMQSNMKEKDFDLIKLIFQKKLTSNNPKYKMVYGGSSVTAGHDNLFRHSHPLVLESRMRPIFEALGVDFEVNNIAQGANDCHPANLCYDAMAGEGGDFYFWEQSFNCGRDYGYVEMIVREAARNEASVYIMSSGGVDTKKCAPSTEEKPLRSDADWKPSSPVQFTEESITQLKTDLIDVNKLGQSMGTSAVGLMKRYQKSPAASGMNVWFAYPKSLCSDVVPELKACDIPNLMEGCVGLKFLSREASVYANGGGAGHHPSRAMHMMRGEIITWSYTIALLDAMFAIRKDLVDKKALTSMNDGFSTSLAEQYSTIPEPLLCGKAPYYCKKGYTCATDYSPKYTDKYFLKDLLVKTTPPTQWKYMVHPIEKRQTDRIELKDKEMRNHFATRGGPQAGEIFFRVNIISSQDGHVAVCLEGIEKKTPMARIEYRFDLNVGEKVLSPDFVYNPKPNRSAWESKTDLNHCMVLNNIPVGIHVLGMESKGGYVGVSHIITWKP